MRADRLLSILLLLQARGKMTARELASELEVSERTIYRDINALCIAGVPVCSEPGPEGGYSLIDRYRTNLTGLTEGELRALFMLGTPAPLADLGMSREIQAALRKLSAALPDSRRGDEEKVRRRFHLDSTWWHHGAEQVPYLQAVHQAVWQNRRLHVRYRPHFTIELERLLDPYGLVAKAGIWYLVCARNEAIHVHRVSDLSHVRLAEESFERPADFDLVAYWEAWCAEYESYQSMFVATVRIAPDFISELPRHFGSRIHRAIAQAGPPDEDGWISLELSFRSFAAARERILGFGRGVEVLEPPALRRSVLDYAEQIVSRYM